MQETTGLLDQVKHHDKLSITVNQNCAIPLPDDVLQKLLGPHKLAFYYFLFMDRGSATFKADLKDVTISDGQLVFGLPNQIFTNSLKSKNDQYYKVSLDENTLALLPQSYPFLVNPFQSNIITFDPDSKLRVKAIFSFLFQLLHSSGKQQNPDIILAHLHTLFTELNSAYFTQHGKQDTTLNPKMSKYVAFKLAVETHLTEQQEVHTIAEQLAMTTSSLYGLVKEFAGVSPKEWITNRLMLEAQRKLQYSTTLSVKELAY